MKLSAILEPLVAAGVDAQTILATVRAWEAQQTDALEQRRASDRERQARKRGSHVTSRDVTVTVSSRGGVARGEDNLQTKNYTGQEEKKKTPRDELAAVLDPEHAAAVVDHRQSMRKPLTAYAARQLAAKMAKCQDPNAAADEMISNGWQGFKPEWLESRSSPQHRATAPPGRTVSDVLGDIKAGRLEVPSILDLIKGKTDEPPEHSGPTIDAGFERADFGSPGRSNQLYAFPSGHRSR